MAGNRLICGCMRVYEDTIREACANGASNYTDIQNMTGAGTSCGNCRILIERILRSVREEMEQGPEKAEN